MNEQKIEINGQKFTKIGYFDLAGRVIETIYPTENLPYLAGRTCFWVVKN